jgi:serine O-acetyltransferase
MEIATRLASLYRTPLAPFACVALKVIGCEMPRSVSIGEGLRLPHRGLGVVIHRSTVIGRDVKVYQGVTIGRADVWRDASRSGGVKIGDGAIIGAGAKVLFAGGDSLEIGRNAVVGANAVVTESIPDGEVWAGIPARRVGRRS